MHPAVAAAAAGKWSEAVVSAEDWPSVAVASVDGKCILHLAAADSSQAAQTVASTPRCTPPNAKTNDIYLRSYNLHCHLEWICAALWTHMVALRCTLLRKLATALLWTSAVLPQQPRALRQTKWAEYRYTGRAPHWMLLQCTALCRHWSATLRCSSKLPRPAQALRGKPRCIG